MVPLNLYSVRISHEICGSEKGYNGIKRVLKDPSPAPPPSSHYRVPSVGVFIFSTVRLLDSQTLNGFSEIEYDQRGLTGSLMTFSRPDCGGSTHRIPLVLHTAKIESSLNSYHRKKKVITFEGIKQ